MTVAPDPLGVKGVAIYPCRCGCSVLRSCSGVPSKSSVEGGTGVHALEEVAPAVAVATAVALATAARGPIEEPEAPTVAAP